MSGRRAIERLSAVKHWCSIISAPAITCHRPVTRYITYIAHVQAPLLKSVTDELLADRRRMSCPFVLRPVHTSRVHGPCARPVNTGSVNSAPVLIHGSCRRYINWSENSFYYRSIADNVNATSLRLFKYIIFYLCILYHCKYVLS